MRSSEPQELANILENAVGLLQIQERTIALTKLNKIISGVLPSQLNQHCRVANYRQHILVIQVSSASWLTRLKYEQSNLLLELRRKALPSLSSIQYQIMPDIAINNQLNTNYSLNQEKMARSMTKESAFFLFRLAEHAPEQLKKQLIKLANHAK